MAGTYAALAALLRGAGRAAEALAYAQLAAAAQESAAGARSPAAAAAALAVAEILADLGRSAPCSERFCAVSTWVTVPWSRLTKLPCGQRLISWLIWANALPVTQVSGFSTMTRRAVK